MAKFEFRSRKLGLDIAGNHFEIEVSTDIGDIMAEFSREGFALIPALKSGEKTIEDAVEYCRSAIDRILGEGSVDIIFKDRKIDITDLSDVILFITGEIQKFKAGK
jgi:hypothetical protein